MNKQILINMKGNQVSYIVVDGVQYATTGEIPDRDVRALVSFLPFARDYGIRWFRLLDPYRVKISKPESPEMVGESTYG